FFQAEDGIRDFHVTGVQTCALPIWRDGRWCDRLHALRYRKPSGADRPETPRFEAWSAVTIGRYDRALRTGPEGWHGEWEEPDSRSEERRVGNETRARRDGV